MNELDRMKMLAGIITENIAPITGIDEMFDTLSEELDPAEENLIHQYMSGDITREEFMQHMDSIAATDVSMRQGEMGMQGDDTPQGNRAWGREQDDWQGMDESATIDEKAPPGMEDMVLKLKKQYPGHEEKAFATAWSIYNKKHGKTDESMMDEDNSIDDATVQSAIVRVKDMMASHVSPMKATDTLIDELEAAGHDDDTIAQIIDAVAAAMNSQGGEDEDDDGSCPSCSGTGEGQYGDSSCTNCGGSGFLKYKGDSDDFDEPDDSSDDWTGPLEESEEIDECELNNGYDDIHFMNPGDFFPDGADSPVTTYAGPSSARQGDNPEQKKIAVAETHKELVYNYRRFLKESSNK